MFKELLAKLLPKKQEKQMISPLPERMTMINPDYEPSSLITQAQAQAPTPTATPTPQPYRLPQWETWKKQNPSRFNELLSATAQASQAYPKVPQSLLMDISGLETSGGQFLDQLSGGPGQGYFMFEPTTLRDIGADINPYSATESARLAAELINKGQISRWGKMGRKWGTIDNQRRPASDRLSTYYTQEELAL